MTAEEWLNQWLNEWAAEEDRRQREVLIDMLREAGERARQRRARPRPRPRSSYRDDRDRSVSLRACSGGLPTLGKRR